MEVILLLGGCPRAGRVPGAHPDGGTPSRRWDTIPLPARGLRWPQRPLASPWDERCWGSPGTREAVATPSSSGGDAPWVTSRDGRVLAQSPAGAVPGADHATDAGGCHGAAVARPRQAAPTLLFPSGSFHNAESN